MFILSMVVINLLFAREDYAVVLPTINVESVSENDELKGYLSYDEASITKNKILVKENPYTIDIINIQRNKNYGQNDLSSILEGNAGIDTTYDMRADNIYIRGFSADSNDIYIDGVRDSGQVRRSTANIERIEILKGPASVLYGRSSGGGIINMVSKSANLDSKSSVGIGYGSYENKVLNLDINEAFMGNFAFRITGQLIDTNSFREYINEKSKMISPSLLYTNGGFSYLLQYTYDYAKRIPDRGPSKSQYDKMGIDYKKTFARIGDNVEDELVLYRSKLSYNFNEFVSFDWLLSYRQANQNFDHYYGGTYNPITMLLSQSYAWQKTDNKTLANQITSNVNFNTASIKHKVVLGYDFSKEKRLPLIGTKRGQSIDPFTSRQSWDRLSDVAATIDNKHVAYNNAIFLQDLVYLTDDLKIMLGGRYDFYKFSSVDIKNRHNEYDGNLFNYNSGIVYNINDIHTAYYSFNKSFSPYGGMGYIGISTTSDPNTFNKKPEFSKQHEIGIKSDYFNNTLSTTLSIYNLEHYNIKYRPDPNNLFLWAIRGKERSRGIEFNSIGRIIDTLFVRTSAGLMNAKIEEDKQNPKVVGKRLNNTSQFNANLFLRYLPITHLYVETGVVHSGKKYYHNRTGKEDYLPSFTRYDAMVGYNYKNFSLSLAVVNLLDKEYWRSDAMPGSSRSFMSKLSYQF